jgi:hypothetical protein
MPSISLVSYTFLVFGVELEFLLEREANGAQPEIGSIPSVILSCLSEVEFRGLSEVGICMLWRYFLLQRPDFFFRSCCWRHF